MQIQTDLTRADYDAFVRFISRKAMRAKKGARWIIAIAAAAGATLVVSILIQLARRPLDLPSFAAGAVAFVLWFLIIARARVFRLGPAPGGLTLGPRTISVESDGLRLKSDRQSALYYWSTVRSVDLTEQHLFVVLDAHSAVIIPLRAFASISQREEFIREVKTRAQLLERGVGKT